MSSVLGQRANQLLTIDEAASRLAVSKSFMRSLVNQGQLNPVRIGANIIRFRELEIDEIATGKRVLKVASKTAGNGNRRGRPTNAERAARTVAKPAATTTAKTSRTIRALPAQPSRFEADDEV